MNKNINPLSIVFMILGAAAYGTGSTFKSMHWAGGRLITIGGGALFIIGIFIAVIHQSRRNRR